MSGVESGDFHAVGGRVGAAAFDLLVSGGGPAGVVVLEAAVDQQLRRAGVNRGHRDVGVHRHRGGGGVGVIGAVAGPLQEIAATVVGRRGEGDFGIVAVEAVEAGGAVAVSGAVIGADRDVQSGAGRGDDQRAGAGGVDADVVEQQVHVGAGGREVGEVEGGGGAVGGERDALGGPDGGGGAAGGHRFDLRDQGGGAHDRQAEALLGAAAADGSEVEFEHVVLSRRGGEGLGQGGADCHLACVQHHEFHGVRGKVGSRGIDDQAVAGDGPAGFTLFEAAIDERTGGGGLHGDADGGEVGGEHTIAGAVGEGVGAAEAGVRRVGEGTVGGEVERAAGRTGDEHGGERGAVDVAVVVEDAGRGDGECLAFGSGVAVAGSNGSGIRSIDRGHRVITGHGDGGGRGVGEVDAVAGPLDEVLAAGGGWSGEGDGGAVLIDAIEGGGSAARAVEVVRAGGDLQAVGGRGGNGQVALDADGAADVVDEQVAVGAGRGLVEQRNGGGGAVGNKEEGLRGPLGDVGRGAGDGFNLVENLDVALGDHLQALLGPYGTGAAGDDAHIEVENVGLARGGGDGLGDAGVGADVAGVGHHELGAIGGQVGRGGVRDQPVAGDGPTGFTLFEAAVDQRALGEGIHGDRHGDDVRIEAGVAGLVGERIAAGEAGVWLIDEAAVRVQRGGAI